MPGKQKQLREEKLYFGSGFADTVHRVEEAVASGT